MKVVVNDGIGGFGLSNKAFERLIELGMIVTELDEKGQPINPDADIFTYNYYDINEKFPNEIRYGFVEFEDDIKIRSHPLVINVVEELGTDANDECAVLKITEVPDGIKCEICSSEEGYEWIAEKHRTWR